MHKNVTHGNVADKSKLSTGYNQIGLLRNYSYLHLDKCAYEQKWIMPYRHRSSSQNLTWNWIVSSPSLGSWLVFFLCCFLCYKVKYRLDISWLWVILVTQLIRATSRTYFDSQNLACTWLGKFIYRGYIFHCNSTFFESIFHLHSWTHRCKGKIKYPKQSNADM